ncbi:type I restriction enzyme R protein, N-terminal domain protein [Leptospira kirschneri serovar Grippotyphosa str. RM52]|nr:type I restriction enzyme R protein, N-terminal domain protein [Leptospira kirschneri serovar Grippotyphosa str. RM52]
MHEYRPIAESNHFIVLDKYIREWQVSESYQSEADLERELVQDLINQGYEFLSDLNTPEKMLANVRDNLQSLNGMQFSEGEWIRFVETWLNKPVIRSQIKPVKFMMIISTILSSMMDIFKTSIY